MRLLSFYVFTLVAVFIPAGATNYSRFMNYIIHQEDVEGFCVECESALALLKNDPEGTLLEALDSCKTSHFFPERVCDEEYRIYAGSIVKIIEQLKRPLNEACMILSDGACKAPGFKLFDWKQHLEQIQDDSSFSSDYFLHNESDWKKTHLSVLHLTDTHYDKDYEVGRSANCKEPTCCTIYQPISDNVTYAAGPYGFPLGAACNIPLRTVRNMFEDIEKNRYVSFGLWTGDISPHNVIGRSREDLSKDIEETTAIIKRYLQQTKIYTAMGNHDLFPARLLAPPGVEEGNFSMRPVYVEMWSLWYDWLPSDQEETFKYGGYYTAKPNDRLRIISLNTNFCYTSNWWLVLANDDPAEQLRWLIKTLETARRNRERVFIVGHIPPGSSACAKRWQQVYLDIVTKFSKTITGQFFGHTHSDEIILDYGDPANKTKPTTVQYVSPSVTTSWSGMPEYRILQTEMGEIVDIETYFLNLTTANAYYFEHRETIEDLRRSRKGDIDVYEHTAWERVAYGVPEWELGYSARQAYGLRKFDAENWSQLIQSLDRNNSLLQTFYKHHMQFRENIFNVANPCNASCKASLLSKMITSRSRPTSKFAQNL